MTDLNGYGWSEIFVGFAKSYAKACCEKAINKMLQILRLQITFYVISPSIEFTENYLQHKTAVPPLLYSTNQVKLVLK